MVDQLESTSNTEKTMSDKRTEQLFKILKSLNGKDQITFFELVVNPESYSQTIENIFDFAALIKDGNAGVVMKDNNMFAGIFII